MKILEKVLPYVLLISYSILCHFRVPEISDSIVLFALASLVGFRSYLNYKQQPNYVEIFEKKLAEINKELELKEKRITDVQNSVGMQNMAKQRKDNLEKMVW